MSRPISEVMKDVNSRLSELNDQENEEAELNEEAVNACEDNAENVVNTDGENFNEVESENADENVNSFNETSEDGKEEAPYHPDPLFQVSLYMNLKNMYKFLLFHSYKGVAGILNILLFITPIGLLIYELQTGENKYMVLYILLIVLFASNPLQILSRANKQVKSNPTFKDPFVYEFSTEGITVCQQGQFVFTKWLDMAKVYETSFAIIVYIRNRGVFVFAKDQIPDQIDDVRRMLNENVSQVPAKWKKVKKSE